MFASTMFIYLIGEFGVTIQAYNTPQTGAYIGIWNTFALAVFIYATAPATGGHINPLITCTTMLSGLCPFSRGILYILFQTAGGALAGAILRGSLGIQRADSRQGGGCFFDPAAISPGQVFLTEIMCSAALTYLVLGVGLDPRRSAVLGPQLGPILVGLCLGVVSFVTSSTAPDSTGASMFPTKCLAQAVARKDFSNFWIWWIGPALGGLLTASLYNILPPGLAQPTKAQPIQGVA